MAANSPYTPLLGENRIRLVEILPASSPEEEIRITLVNAVIDEAPSYQALSYIWGDLEQKSTIICDGRTMSIRSNLSRLLRSLRRNKKRFSFLSRDRAHSDLFWIDAISVNQSDAKERYHQVTQMPLIYFRAAQTILPPEIFQNEDSFQWLGDENSPLIEAAFDLISHLTRARREVFQHSPLEKPKTSTLEAYRQLLPSELHPGWKGLNELLTRSYFQRGWIVQDIMCSNDMIVRCGELSMPWTELSYALEGYSSYGHPNNVTSSGARMIVEIEVARRHRLAMDSLSLDEILDIIRPLTTTDPRDKAYAAISILLGLNYHTTNLPAPDYSRTYEEVFKDISLTLNIYPELGGYFCGLSMVEDSASCRSNTSNLPSWAPDWNIPRQIYRLNTNNSLLSASQGRSTQLSLQSRAGTFAFRGCVIDKLNEAPHYLPPRRFYDKYAASGDNSIFFSYWFDLAQTSGGRTKYKREEERILHWAETIQAKGCALWQALEPHDPAELLLQTQAWLEYLQDENQAGKETEEIRQFYAACLPSHGRRFGITRRGNFCLVPRFAIPGDQICIPFGSKVPFVFRPVGEEYLNIGECYVHGAMNGEALAWENIHEMNFVLR